MSQPAKPELKALEAFMEGRDDNAHRILKRMSMPKQDAFARLIRRTLSAVEVIQIEELNRRVRT